MALFRFGMRQSGSGDLTLSIVQRAVREHAIAGRRRLHDCGVHQSFSQMAVSSAFAL
jgi:hypothetical protein